MSPPILMGSELDLAIESILSVPARTSSPSLATSIREPSPLYGQSYQTTEHASAPDVIDLFPNPSAFVDIDPAQVLLDVNLDVPLKSVPLPLVTQIAPPIPVAGHPTGGEAGHFGTDLKPLAEMIMKELIDDAVLGTVLESHRTAKLGLLFLYDPPQFSDSSASEREKRSPGKRADGRPTVKLMRIYDAPGVDVFGQPLITGPKQARQQDCCCPQCGRNLAASRFAPHLEKCMGMGRNSYRLANRRMMAARATSERPASTGSVHSAASNNDTAKVSGPSSRRQMDLEPEENSDDDEDEHSDEFQLSTLPDDEEDDDWTEVRKRKLKKKPVYKKPQERKSIYTPGKLNRSGSEAILLNELLHTSPLAKFNENPNPFGAAHRNKSSPNVSGETMRLRNRTVKKPKPKGRLLGDTSAQSDVILLNSSDSSRDTVYDEMLQAPIDPETSRLFLAYENMD